MTKTLIIATGRCGSSALARAIVEEFGERQLKVRQHGEVETIDGQDSQLGKIQWAYLNSVFVAYKTFLLLKSELVTSEIIQYILPAMVCVDVVATASIKSWRQILKNSIHSKETWQT